VNTAFVYIRPKKVAFVRVRGSYAASSIEAWNSVFDWLEDHGLKSPVGRGYGLMHDNPRLVPPARCRYDACIEVPLGAEELLPDHISTQILPGGAYARERHTGGIGGLRDKIARLRDEWAPANGIAVDAKRPFIEIFYDDPAVVPEERWTIDVCVPVVVSATKTMSRGGEATFPASDFAPPPIIAS